MSLFLLEGKNLKQQQEVVSICVTWCWIYGIYPEEVLVKDNSWYCLNHEFRIQYDGIEERDDNGLVSRWYSLKEAVDNRTDFSWLRDRLTVVDREFQNADKIRTVLIFLTEEQIREAEQRLLNRNHIDLSGYTGASSR